MNSPSTRRTIPAIPAQTNAYRSQERPLAGLTRAGYPHLASFLGGSPGSARAELPPVNTCRAGGI